MSSIFLVSVVAQSQANDLSNSILTLTDAKSNEYLLLAVLRGNYSDDDIISTLVPALRTQKGFAEQFARGRGFTMLLELGTINPDGKRKYTNHSQVQLLIDELNDDEAPSSIQIQIINSLHSVQAENREAFIALLPEKLKSPMYWMVRSSLQALAIFGNELSGGQTEARSLLADPSTANPAMIEKLQQFTEIEEAEVAELISKLRSDAAKASIALGGLAEDLALYPHLDEQGQEAAAQAILMFFSCNCRVDPLPTTQLLETQAVQFAIDFFSTPLQITDMPNEAIGALQRLASPSMSPSIRSVAIDGLKRISGIHPDPVMRNHILSTLERFDPISSTNE